MRNANTTAEPLLLEVTRLVARGWTERQPTGIDRVTQAYLRHYAPCARAVVQHRGAVKIFTMRDSQRLFAILDGPAGTMRARIAAFAPGALLRAAPSLQAERATYLNVSHTDFDLPRHVAWVERSRLRPIYLVHDLIPINHPEYCRPHAVRRHRGRVVNALRHGAGIIVNSQATARELKHFAEHEGLPVPPMIASWLAGAPLARPRAPAPAERAERQPDYFVCLGTIEPRKNHALLLDVWERLASERDVEMPRLLLIGQWGRGSEAVRKRIAMSPALRRHVNVLSRCSDAELQGWLAGARAMLLPTRAEGFGLPLVEGLALHTPVIASDLPCFAEIGQGIPTLLDPDDLRAWHALIDQFGPDHPEHRRQLGLMDHFRAPSWEDHFAAVDDWLFAPPASAKRFAHNHVSAPIAVAARTNRVAT